MSAKPDDQTQQLSDDLDRLIERYRDEYDVTYATVVGVLMMKVWLLNEESQGRSDEV
jgi:hypothetical protein